MANEEKTQEAPKVQTKPEQEENLFAKEAEDMAVKLPESAEDVSESEEEDDGNEVISTKGFSNKAKSEYVVEYEKIGMNEEWPEEGRVLTIEQVYPQSVKKSDKPIMNDNGGYFKKKLMVCFKESRMVTMEGKELDLKYREPVPSIFYGFDKGVVSEPRIPKACEKDDLDDNFTSMAAKMRYHFYDAYPETDKKQSDLDYTEILKDKKVLVIKKNDKWKDNGVVKKYCKLIIKNFVA